MTSAFRLEIASHDPFVLDALSPLSLADFRALGDVEQGVPQLGGTSLERAYSFRVRATDLFVMAGGEEYRLLGVGPRGRIGNFAGLLDGLLGGDLATLRSARTAAPVLAVCPHAVVAALQVFLASSTHAFSSR